MEVQLDFQLWLLGWQYQSVCQSQLSQQLLDWIVMKFHTDIYGSQIIYPIDLS